MIGNQAAGFKGGGVIRLQGHRCEEQGGIGSFAF